MWENAKEQIAKISLGLLCAYFLLLIPQVAGNFKSVVISLVNQYIVMAYVICLITASTQVIDITEKYITKILSVVTSITSIFTAAKKGKDKDE